jgi:uncharacterized protein (UPF0335 family)
VGSAQIKAFAERLMRMLDEAEALNADIREIRAEAKASGYSVKALNAAVRRARMTGDQREKEEQYEMEFSLYYSAIVGEQE